MGILRKNKVMEKIDKIEKKQEESKLSEDDIQTIQSVFTDTFSNLDDGNEDKLEKIDLAKVIIKEILNVDRHLSSTTNLSKEMIYDFSKTKYLNRFFKASSIEHYMNDTMKFLRSETKNNDTNLLNSLLNIGNNSSMRNNYSVDESKGILGGRWKR